MQVKLPVKFKGERISLVYAEKKLRLRLKDIEYLFVVNPRLFYITIFLLVLILTFQLLGPNLNKEQKAIQLNGKVYKNDVIGYFIDYFNEVEKVGGLTSLEENFAVKKQMLLSKYIIKNKVSQLNQLNDEELLKLNTEISNLYLSEVLPKVTKDRHVVHYFSDTTDLKKIETALMEQIKYNLPASIKLAQSALETAYGRKVIHNNYFGIKAKKQKGKVITTTEYYTKKEVAINSHKIVRKEVVKKGGKTLYKCLIKDSFSTYKTPWDSFRAHSQFLKNQKRYAPLFTEGKNYEAWADKIGSTKYGGVGYATSPIYGELLKKIIRRYKLNLLDH